MISNRIRRLVERLTHAYHRALAEPVFDGIENHFRDTINLLGKLRRTRDVDATTPAQPASGP